MESIPNKLDFIDEVTLGGISAEIGINLKIINDFLHTFEFHSSKWVEYSKYHYISHETKISGEMADFLRDNRKLVRAFKGDYDAAKSVHQISRKIVVDSVILLHYLNNYSVLKSTHFNQQLGHGAEELQKVGVEVTNLSQDGKINLQTRLRNVSSFQLLKDVQIYRRRSILLEGAEMVDSPY